MLNLVLYKKYNFLPIVYIDIIRRGYIIKNLFAVALLATKSYWKLLF